MKTRRAQYLTGPFAVEIRCGDERLSGQVRIRPRAERLRLRLRLCSHLATNY
jgi:hypothetical protein